MAAEPGSEPLPAAAWRHGGQYGSEGRRLCEGRCPHPGEEDCLGGGGVKGAAASRSDRCPEHHRHSGFLWMLTAIPGKASFGASFPTAVLPHTRLRRIRVLLVITGRMTCTSGI